jgi:hypothetical protein
MFVCCLTSIERYFMHIQDETKVEKSMTISKVQSKFVNRRMEDNILNKEKRKGK